MAVLTAKTRAALPDKVFAGPNRSFPIQDAAHARAALAYIRYAPEGSKAHIRAIAHAMLARKRK